MDSQNEISKVKEPRARCKNCEKKLPKQGEFCPSCGQRDFDGRIRMRDLLAKFFANFTHLDNKFIQMSWQLFVPARVTLNYFEGKIKRYPHPFQFFFIVMFFFLFMFGKLFGGAEFEPTGTSFNLSVGEKDTTLDLENVKRLQNVGLFGVLEKYTETKKYRAEYDYLPEAWRTPLVRQALDSVVRRVNGPWEDAAKYILEVEASANPGNVPNYDTLPLNFGMTSVRIAIDDLVHLTPDSIIKKYQIEAWDEKITVRQGIKSLKDPKGLITRYIGSFGWAILVLIAVMSFVLKLLYWRRGGYYVEHFIFLIHQQSGAFLLITIGLVVGQYLFSLQWFWLVIMAWIGLSLLLAMKRFYKENWAWTLTKWLFYCVLYITGLISLFVGTMLVVFVVF